MRRLIVLALLAAASPVAAQDRALPALFDVVEVAKNDKLNVRAEPKAEAAVVGTLAPDAKGIEVVALDATGEWGRVNVGEVSGWAALRFLSAGPDTWASDGVPETLRCFGTEPFWSLRPEDKAAIYTSPDAPDKLMELTAVLAGPPGSQRRALVARGKVVRMTALIAPAQCIDGMSDRAFGLGVDVVVEGDGDPRLLAGCCSIAPLAPSPK